MVVLLIWALATIGLTDILMFGKILDDDHLKVRSWLKKVLGKYADMLDCSVCTGWWSGLLLGILLVSFNPLYFIGCAFAGAGLMHAYVNIMNLIESKTDFIVGDNHDEQPEQPKETTP